MRHRRVGPGHRWLRIAVSIGVAFSGIGAGRLAAPAPVVAIDCNLVLNPFAADDPTTPGDNVYSTYEDVATSVNSTYGVLANDSCKDGLTSVSTTNQVAGSWIIYADGSLSYTPEPDFNGAATAQYRFMGTYGTSNWATVTITVISVNDPPNYETAPDAECTSMLVQEDAPTTTDDTCFYLGDPGGGRTEMLNQTLTPHASSSNTAVISTVGLTVTPTANGQIVTHLQFKPVANASGQATLSFWLTDNGSSDPTNNKSAVYTTLVIVQAVDDPPNAVNDGYATAFGAALQVPAGSGVLKNDSDVDGPALTASKVSGPGHGTASVLPDGSFLYAPAAGYSGPDSFVYRATAGSKSDTATVAISVGAPGATVPPPPGTPAPAATAGGPGGGPSPVPAESGGPAPSAAETVPPVAVASGSPGPATSPVPGAGNPGGTTGEDGGPWLVLLIGAALIVAVVVGVAIGSRRARAPSARDEA